MLRAVCILLNAVPPLLHRVALTNVPQEANLTVHSLHKLKSGFQKSLQNMTYEILLRGEIGNMHTSL